MQKIKIPVNNNHLALGKRGCNRKCAVVLAIRDHLDIKPEEDVTMNYHYNGDIYGVCVSKKFDYISPKQAKWLNDYDRGLPVEPIIFTLILK